MGFLAGASRRSGRAEGGAPVLRLRDDCVLFNFKEKAEKREYDPENPEKGVGIRTVMAAAKDISCSSTMKTNNLIITM